MNKDSKLVENCCALCDVCSIAITSLCNPKITIVPVPVFGNPNCLGGKSQIPLDYGLLKEMKQ